jgi:hypothetical protein
MIMRKLDERVQCVRWLCTRRPSKALKDAARCVLQAVVDGGKKRLILKKSPSTMDLLMRVNSWYTMPRANIQMPHLGIAHLPLGRPTSMPLAPMRVCGYFSHRDLKIFAPSASIALPSVSLRQPKPSSIKSAVIGFMRTSEVDDAEKSSAL